jgi:dihydrofolate synthase/folylpolyglutamate synthase
MLFDEERVDLVVLETGLGGRLDCTNVCRPLVNVITSIGLDHTHILGDTLSQIAAEKAGILKPGIPVVQGQLPEVADIVITTRAQKLGCRQFVCGRDFAWQIDHNEVPPSDRQRSQAFMVLTPTRRYDDLTIPLLGQHQVHNASLAVMTAELLKEAGMSQIDVRSIQQGLRATHWPLRFEVFDRNPTIVLDAAHNPDSMRAVASVLTGSEWLNRRRILVFAVSADKDARSMAEIILPNFDDAVFTRFLGNPRSRPPEELLSISESLPSVQSHSTGCHTALNPASALERARHLAGPTGVVVVTGSIFLASEVRSLLTNPDRT